MTILKVAMTISYKGLIGNSITMRPQNHKMLLTSATTMYNNQQRDKSNYRENHLTRNMALVSSGGHKLCLEQSKGKILDPGSAGTFKVTPYTEGAQPLVVLLPWLMSNPKHVHKYSKLYLKLGFDVLTVRLTPWQLLWPIKGSQLVAGDLLQFLDVNKQFGPLLVHGFSVGGYLWGELMSLAERDRERYSKVMDRIVGHIWDSAADMQDIQDGLPIAVFPKNFVLQRALKQYVKYHMRTFYDTATSHYIRSSQMFHSSMVRSPALMFYSKNDPIGKPESNMRVRENWESLGIKTYVKCFEKSIHVGHFHRYPEEYTAEVATFLATIGLLPVACKMQAKI